MPDTPPADDSELFAPPPIELAPPPPPAKVRRLPALMRKVNAKVRGHTLLVRFLLTRKARVSLLAHRKGPGGRALEAEDDAAGPAHDRAEARSEALADAAVVQDQGARAAGRGGGGGDTPVDNGDVITTGLR